MYSIAYIIPYFGKLRTDFPLWLESCRHNPTVDFHVITDDHSYENHTEKTYFSIICSFQKCRKEHRKFLISKFIWTDHINYVTSNLPMVKYFQK